VNKTTGEYFTDSSQQSLTGFSLTFQNSSGNNNEEEIKTLVGSNLHLGDINTLVQNGNPTALAL